MEILGALLVAFTDNLATSMTSQCNAVTSVKVIIISPHRPCQAILTTGLAVEHQISGKRFTPPAVLEKVKEGEGKKYRKATAAAKKISVDAAVSSSFIRAGWHFHLSGRRENSAEGFSRGRGGEKKDVLAGQ